MQLHSNLEVWIRETLSTVDQSGDDESPGVMHRFEVWHAGEDTHERLRVFRIADRNEALPEMSEPLAADVLKVCEQHAVTLSQGTHLRYSVQAWRSVKDAAAEAVHYIVLTGTALTPAAGTSIAAERGQLIRHNETLHTMMMNMVNSLAGRLSRDLEDEREARREAERNYGSVIRLREEMLDRKAERELEMMRESRDAEQKGKMLDMIGSFAPVVLAKLAGAGGTTAVPEVVKLRDEAVGNIMRKLTPEEIQAIAMNVRPEIQAAFLELVNAWDPPPQPQSGNKTPGAKGN